MADFKRLAIGSPGLWGTGTTLGTFALNGTTDQMEWMFQVPDEAGASVVITHLGFRHALRALTPPTYKISLQGVDASGNPDGTIKGGASPASATFTPPASTAWDGTWQWIALANSYTAAPGEMLASVIAYDSGTVDATNNSTFNTQVSVLTNGLPYAQTNDATVRTRSQNVAVFGYKSASKVYGFPLLNAVGTTFSSTSTPDEYALCFTRPANIVAAYQVGGVRFIGRPGVAAKSAKLILYSGTTVLQDVTIDTDFVSAGTATLTHTFWFDETTLATLVGGGVYRIGWQAQDTAQSAMLLYWQMASAADAIALPGGGDWFLSTRTDAGAWTDDTASRPVMELILTDVTPPAGGVSLGRLVGRI